MTQDPKKLPAWLRKESANKKKSSPPPPAAPPPSDPPEDAANEEIPPWLREDLPEAAPPAPPSSGLRRLAPPPENGEDQGEVAPWLRGLDEPKSYSIGGTELSEEYLAGGDELAASDESELTFDLWMAEQTESKREKDIEEEVPDLLSAIEEDKSTPAPPVTGQLPDWFLGLEELDTSDAPEWFNAEAEPPTGANEPPPWISDMVEESNAPAGAPADDIASFFDSLGGSPPGSTPPSRAAADDEGEPDLNWLIDQPPLDVGNLPVDDFFAEVPDTPQDDDGTPDWFYQSGAAAPSDDDSFADQLDDFAESDAEADAEAHAIPAVEIPQNELDAFFDNLAADRAAHDSNEDTADIEEPDLAWFVDETPAESEAPGDDIPEPDLELFSEDDQNTLNWLNELGGIVSSASRSSQPYQSEAPASFADTPDDSWSLPPAPAEDLNWSNLPDDAADRAAADVAPEDDWLRDIAPDQSEEDDRPDESDTLPLSPSGLLHRSGNQPDYSAPAESEPDEVVQIDWEDSAPGAGSSEPPAAVEEPTAYEEATIDEQDDRFAQDNAEEDAAIEVDAADAESDQDDDLIPTDELHSGWLTDDLLAEAEFSDALAEPGSEAAPAEDTSEQSDDDYLQALAQDDLFGEIGSDDAPDDDFLSALGLDAADEQQPEEEADESAYEMPSTGDLYAELGMNAADEQQPEETETSDNDLFGQWNDQPEEEADEFAYEMPSTGDLYAELGMNAADEQQPEETETSDNDLFGQWNDQPEEEADESAYEMPSTGDLYAELGMNADDEQQPAETETSDNDLFGQWNDQPEEEADESAYEVPDLYSEIGMNADDEQPAEAAASDDLFGQWNDQPEEAADESAYEVPDLYSEIGMNADDEQPEETETSDDDLFGQWNDQPEEEAAPADGLFEQWSDQPDDEEAAPTDEAPAESEPEAEASAEASADFFNQWGDQPEEDKVSLEDGFYAALQARDQQPKAPPERGQDEFFDKWNTEAEMPPEEEFFEALGMISDEDVPTDQPAAGWDDRELPPEGDFFAALGMIDSGTPPAEGAPQSEFGDIEGYLASLSSEQPQVEPETNPMFSQSSEDIDLDALFSEPVMTDKPAAPPSGIDTTPGMGEAWLAELQASVGEVSASAIVRQKEDRPVDELPDRLKRLRQRGETVADQASAAPAPESGALDDVLPGGSAGLMPAPFVAGMTMLQSVALTADQQQKVDLLKALTPSSSVAQASRMSAIEMTYDSPFMPGLEDSAENIVQPERTRAAAPARSRRRLRLNLRLDRLLIAVVLAAALIAPFLVPSLRFGDLPPQTFPAGSAAQIAFDQVDALPAGALVLVGMEYEPTAAAELDGMTDALLRHIILRAAYPVLVGGNPISILRAENLIASINADSDFLARIHAPGALEANQDYYIVRYLPGSVIGLRAFSAAAPDLLLTDIRGQATNLRVRSFADFALVAVVTDRAEDLRGYAEQIAPLTRAPLIAAVSYGAAPLAQPYAQTFGGGLLVGYQDAYTYRHALDTVRARSIAQRIRIIPTDTPTPVPTALPPTTAPQAAVTAEATLEAAAPLGGATPGAPTQVKSLGTATVISSQSVNMRAGPGTNNPVIAGVPSGTQLDVIGFNPDETWVNVRLDDGQTGWIAATLLDVQRTGAALALPERYAKVSSLKKSTKIVAVRRGVVYNAPTKTFGKLFKRLAQVVDPGQPTRQPTDQPTGAPTGESTVEAAATATPTRTPTRRPTSTPRPTSTTAAAVIEATPETTAEATFEAVAFTLPPHSDGYQDERWYALNSGIIASVLIIGFGTVLNVGRGLLRRGRRR